MLRFFSKFQRSRNIVLLSFSLLLLVGLVIFYIPNTPLNPDGQPGATTAEDDDKVVAEVGSKEILMREYRSQLQAMALQYGRGNSLPLPALKSLGLDKQVLDNLINNRLLLDQAETLNLSGTDREIAQTIRTTFVDNEGKFIGADEYKRRLRLQGTDIERFEEQERNRISETKVRDYITTGIHVSDREIEQRFIQNNTKVDVVYAVFDIEKIRKTYQPTEQDLRAYFDSHQADFKANDPTRQVDYLFISTDDAAKIVPVSDDELRAEYETNKQFELRASVIRLDVLTPADEDPVRAKIEALNQRVRGSKETPGEDFATVARGNSQDPSSSKGGDLGWLKKEPNKSSDWKQRPYSNGLKVGTIDGPFRDGRSWYIMKVTEEREVPFEQMRQTLRATVSNNKAFQKASQLADLGYEKATEFNDLAKAAEVLAKELKVAPATLLRSTPYFKAGDPLPSLGKGAGFASNPAFEDAVSTLKKGEIGDKVSIPGGQAIPRLVDQISNGQQLTFEQARNQVEDKLRREKEPVLVKTRAEELLAKATSAAELEQLAKAQGLEVSTDTNFENYRFPGATGSRNSNTYQAKQLVQRMKEGEVAKTPLRAGTSYIVFAAKKRVEADLSQLPGQKSMIRSTILGELRNASIDAFIKGLRMRYEKEGKLKIKQELIDKMFAETPNPAP
ncbi:MAG: SurA N-terminal domain-containing protein [Acidobacteriota bacterium]